MVGELSWCPSCNKKFGNVANHWSHPNSECEWPDIGKKRIEMLKGLVLGDGSYQKRRGRVVVNMITKDFLQWLSDKFGWLSSDVQKRNSAEEMRNKALESFGDVCSDYDGSAYYGIIIRPHPIIDELFSTWYEGGGISFPKDLELSPTSLKMWYVSDGTVKFQPNGKGRVTISSCNESNRPSEGISYLEKLGFEATYSDSSEAFLISTNDTSDFFDFIGESVPGFEYKWAYQNQNRYNKLQSG